MFEYFPSAYWPNLMYCNAVTCGATVGDVDDACRPARQVFLGGKGENSPEVIAALIGGYAAVAERLQRLAEADVAAGRTLSAGQKQLRAAALYVSLDMQMTDFLDPAKTANFDRLRAAFRTGIALSGAAHDGVEFVGVPYGKDILDGTFIPAAGGGHRAPVVIHVNGGHSTMEWPCLTGMTGQLARRGIASLTFDHPGSGSARFHKGLMFRPDSEVYVAAAIDYLHGRADVDRERIAVCGASLGGYLAPRAAACEKRLKACIVWSALFELTPQRYFGAFPVGGPFDAATDFKLKQLRWQFGVETNRQLWDYVERFTLAGVIERLRVPLLIVQGANDQQTPPFNAERMIHGAVHSPKAQLLVMKHEEGGDQHCNLDNLPGALNVMTDWAAEVLGGRTRAA